MFRFWCPRSILKDAPERLDEHGRAQVKPIPPGALIVTPERLAEVLRDPFTVPVEYLPNLMQVIAGRMGAVLQHALPSR